MSNPLQSMHLWAESLGSPDGEYKDQRELLKVALDDFRIKAGHLVATIRAELPSLTVHDITHLDALWRVAGEIAGPGYPLNPAEAFVFGGAVLLHDAAHVMAAYRGGLNEIKGTLHWQDLIAQRFSNVEPESGSNEERFAIFLVLRHLHAEQAHQLATIGWNIPAEEETIYLLQSLEIRKYYGDLIGEIASSHHWSPDRVAETFKDRMIPCPGFLQPAGWTVDAMKIAFLLRTADAAHMDDQRAPWFLFALHNPQGISALHWRFQAKMGQPTRTSNGELRLSAGSPFLREERKSWWLAFDTARMIDKELRSAYTLMQDEDCPAFAAISVLNIESPESFARQVRVRGWEPVNVGPSVGDIPHLIGALGGTALYGDDPKVPLRELIQNALDAVRARRHLHQPDSKVGEVTVSITGDDKRGRWLHVSDTGIGMSRYVLTNVLLDFGNSLWRSDALREELPGLAKSGFEAGGQFGIGFFSVFMLGEEVHITTRRFEKAHADMEDQWQLTFEEGLNGRPLLSKPAGEDRLSNPGTRVSIKITSKKLDSLLSEWKNPEILFEKNEDELDTITQTETRLANLVSYLCPASDVLIKIKIDSNKIKECVLPGDWKTISDTTLIERVRCSKAEIFPFHSESGKLLGRLGVLARYSRDKGAAITVKGIRGGTLKGLAGIVQASGNNPDAQRINARVIGSLGEWKRWAKQVSESGRLRPGAALQIHPLIPEHDFSVWEMNGEDVSMADIIEHLKSFNELLVHHGSVDHGDEDDVSSNRFDSDFEPVENMLCTPIHTPRNFYWRPEDISEVKKEFPWVLGVKQIDYASILERNIENVWGAFEVDEDEEVVGTVGELDILRRAKTYRKLDD